VVAEIARMYPRGVLDGTFLTNHDMPRVATQLGSDPVRLRLAASILLTLPGTPFVHYGEELGMVGDKPDPDIRTPMPWGCAVGMTGEESTPQDETAPGVGGGEGSGGGPEPAAGVTGSTRR